jgi:hypothetical protein
VRIDSDGNKFTGPSNVGTFVRAVVQPISSTETADGGFNTVSLYRLRLINYPSMLGAQSQIEWGEKRYSSRVKRRSTTEADEPHTLSTSWRGDEPPWKNCLRVSVRTPPTLGSEVVGICTTA